MSAGIVLANAAFGDDPGRWPLPAAATPRERWLRAVVAGGQGRYASALTDLADVCRSARGPLVSLAYSTRASFLRQLGWHDRARKWDGAASALALSNVAGRAAPESNVAGRAAPESNVGRRAAPEADVEARADALIGLAADALGVGRFAASATALERAADLMTESALPRLPVRLAWVSAELAMACGHGAAAVGHAERAVEFAGLLGSARHTLKSDVILAAALCSAGDRKLSRCVADRALEDCARLGMIPLRWALACLLADVGSVSLSTAEVAAVRDDAADIIRSRGGVWAVR